MKEMSLSVGMACALIVPSLIIMATALPVNASAEVETHTPMDTLVPYWYKNFTCSMESVTFTSICNDTNGNLLLCGEGRVKAADPTDTNIVVAKYDLNGTHQWNRTWDYIKLGDGGRPRCDADQFGNLYVTGRAQTAPGDTSKTKDILLLKYDGNGTLLWNKTYDKMGLTDFGSGICVDRAHNCIYVAGQVKCYGATVCNATLLKYDYNGNLKWVREWKNPINERDYFVEPDVDAAGNIYVCGYYDSDPRPDPHAYYDGMVVKYDPDGNEIWNATWGGPNKADFHNAIIVDDSNSCLYVCGQTLTYGTAGKYDNMLVKYDLNGTKIWESTWGSVEEDYNYGLVVSDNGMYVYVFGQYLNSADNQVVITKHDAGGYKLWVKEWGDSDGQGSNDGIVYNNAIYVAAGYGWKGMLMKIDLDGGNSTIMEYYAFILPAGVLIVLFFGVRKTRRKVEEK